MILAVLRAPVHLHQPTRSKWNVPARPDAFRKGIELSPNAHELVEIHTQARFFRLFLFLPPPRDRRLA